MATPKLRFKEFDEDWTALKYEDILNIKYGKDHKKLNSGNIPVFGTGGVMRYVDQFLHDGESILIGRKGTIDSPKYVNEKFWTVDTLFYTEIKEQAVPKFVYQHALQVNWLKLNEATGVPSLNTKSINNVAINLPPLKEQTKIATFLSAVDTKIDELIQKHELLTDYKKGMMQKLFSQKLRFKADDGSDFEDWIKYNIGAIFTEIKDQVLDQDIETYSITAGKGFISQAEKFGRDISGNQNRKYIVLKPNDFSYNKGNSKTFKYGCVYLNRFNHNIAVPNVFISFRTKESNKHYSIFYAQLFESHYLDKHLRLLISSSARMDGLLNISKKGFFEIPIPSPCLEEQTKIANFLTAIDQKIDNVAEQIDHAKTWKKGLLQQMFV